ncbi:MAG: hypothetical protein ACJ8AW_09315 [Rhodopila sp.]
MPVSYQGLLSGLLALTEQTYAPYPVWSGSTTKPVQFTPLPKKAAVRLWRYAQELDRQTKQKGCHGGAIGHTGLKVLHTLIFDFLNFASGRLDPSYAAIARKANLCESAVATALKRLHAAGILAWVRRCREGWTDGRYWREQLTNAYALLPSTGWRGFCPPRDEPPAPHPDTWGKPPPMPSILTAATIERRAGGTLKAAIQVLELGPVNGLEAALARLGRAMLTKEK